MILKIPKQLGSSGRDIIAELVEDYVSALDGFDEWSIEYMPRQSKVVVTDDVTGEERHLELYTLNDGREWLYGFTVDDNSIVFGDFFMDFDTLDDDQWDRLSSNKPVQI